MNEKLGDRELDLMQALWERGEATVTEVHETLLAQDAQVAYTTVQTMLNRLEEKGLVSRQKRGRAFVYRPLMEEPAAARLALGRVIDRFFGGDPAALATHLVAGSIASDDLERLRALIDARRKERKDP
jgi:predicted transcriptional regulator